MSPFRRRLFSLRNKLGFSKEGMAEKLGISRRQYYRWESGPSYPPPAQLKRIAEILNVDVHELARLRRSDREEEKHGISELDVIFTAEDLDYLARITQSLQPMAPGPYTVSALLELLKLRPIK